MKHLPKQTKLLLPLILFGVAFVVLISSCNILGGEEEAPPGPVAFDILAPPANVKALVNSPIQIQSAHQGDISRVDLFVRAGDGQEQQIRSDAPEDGVVMQQWTPLVPGTYTLLVRGIGPDGNIVSEYNRPIQIIDESFGATIAQVGEPPIQIAPTIVAATPAPPPAVEASDAGAAFVVSSGPATVQPTAIPRYPPPPPAPGVPWGPTQAELPNFTAPVCDAAEYLGPVAVAGTRQVVKEQDDIAVKAAAGTIIHRIWEIRNIGTCTWGPGYELAFYGGRAMGTGGVVFESAYPAAPVRRNVVVDESRLIVPEGKPNQQAKLEVLLNVPSIPGIHQSYWRMRNPHGVYFGPIVGITLEVVRDCDSDLGDDDIIYGAPDIREFKFIGVSSNLITQTVTTPLAEIGKEAAYEWSVINATNVDVVIEDPTGNIETRTYSDLRNRDIFVPRKFGEYKFTLFADNGVCEDTHEIKLAASTEPGKFPLAIIVSAQSQVNPTSANVSISSSLPGDQTQLEWEHPDPAVNQFFLIAQGERRGEETVCPFFGWDSACYTTVSDWRPTRKVVLELSGQGGQAHTATVQNVESRICPESFNSAREDHRIVYKVQAFINGRPANPEFSTQVTANCLPQTATQLPTEIQ